MILLVLAWSSLFPACASAAQVDLLLRNGRVFTGDPSHPWASSIAISGERIVALSDDPLGADLSMQPARAIDLEGRFVMAGVNDAHDHVGGVPFGQVVTTPTPAMRNPPMSEVRAALVAAAGAAAPGTWLHLVAGPLVLADPTTPSMLDEAAGDHPAIISAWWGHGVVINAIGRRRLNLSDDSPEIPGGLLVRDPEGRLTGQLDEYAGWSVLKALHSSAGVEATADYLTAYAQRRLAEGVTTVQIMEGNQSPDVFLAAVRRADVPLRLRIIRFPITNLDGSTDNWIASDLPARARVSGVKWVLDGTPIDGLAYRTTPYEGRGDWRGRLNFDPEHLRAQLRLALDQNEPLVLHAVGDATARLVLDQMEAMAAAEQWRQRRVRIEHANGITGAQVARAAALGIVIGQPRPTSPIRSWREAGIPVAYGSDGGFPPFVAFAQVTDPANPHSVSREEAIGLLTTGPALGEFAEAELGRLVPGMLADIVVLSQDITTAPQTSLAETRSVLTIVGGQIAFDGRAP
ncbi:amidohydrolase [Brevundimonas subvibrioides]|uniref:amidohydrolase n=1 Tax=Brevundimonas subvibrioides TaxID=74313 RepID=UPI0022B40FD4|nr:amidohydrolase family protein [Brevundimonas subvibrioides]